MATRAHLIDWLKAGGRPRAARLSRLRTLAARIAASARDLRPLDDAEITRRSREISWRAESGIPLRQLLVGAFALGYEAARRTIGLEYYPVQIMGAISLFDGGIAEMHTGEGKTLTAVLPAYLQALCREGCHIVTVNDYLARRDAQTMGPIYEMLGLSVGCIQTSMQDDERKTQYDKDITYATAKEIGFDFLRDRMRVGANANVGANRNPLRRSRNSVLRGCYFALIDEADSILLDEAKTPLIIGLNQPNEPSEVSLFRWSDRVASQLELDRDFKLEATRHSVYLTDAGCRRVVLTAKPVLIDTIDTERIYKHVELALTAQRVFKRDRDYVVNDEEVAIVDESTGRILDGRKWQDGLHHAVEAKERIPISAGTATAAQITIQSFFRQYTHIAGMTGTGVQAARELRKIYRLGVTSVPTHKPCIREGLPMRIFATMAAKRAAIAAEIQTMLVAGRSVLVGTPSVSASEALSAVIDELGVPHQVLNALRDEKEAEIVSLAGGERKVTIATNMAGRGTDIVLCESLRNAGGLHVIATEMHSSSRIDRQLVGRAARQGDPGSYRFFLSFDDELLRAANPQKLEQTRKQLTPDANGEVSLDWLPFFRKTQRLLERTHRKQRRDLMKHEKQQHELYSKIGLDRFLELTN